MLHIRKLHLANLATHADTQVVLPKQGLVALTGSNGAGKSSLLEGIATALWGESLRGEMGWRDGEPGSVTITTDGLAATRKRSKAGTSKLEWQANDASLTTYETTSKAQAALEHLIGSYDVWRRTCVLSSLDSAAFSLARDSDRKRLLEEFLGLGLFDVALDACRKDRKVVGVNAIKYANAHSELNLKLTFAQSQLQQAEKDQAALLDSTDGMDPASLKSEGKRVALLVEAAAKDVSEAMIKVQTLTVSMATLKSTLAQEEERLRRLGKDACPTCGQNADHVREEMATALARLKIEQQASAMTYEHQLALAKDDLADLQVEHKQLTDKLNKLREQYRLAESMAKVRESVATKMADAKAAVTDLSSKVASASNEAAKAQQEAATLEAVEQVLGLRGVRAQVLDHALGALERQANAWLSRMPTEQSVLSISLTGATTQKSGAVVDAISLKVRGRPYAACSGGERRRVDVAILLALRELAVAAHGRDGSLLCDEVFDALDAQGQADVAAALAEMAQERLVVVITHSPEMVKALRPQVHLHVSLKDGVAQVASV